MEIEQTVCALQTNAHANFPMAENAGYQYMENGGGKHAHINNLWLTVRVGYNVETKSRT